MLRCLERRYSRRTQAGGLFFWDEAGGRDRRRLRQQVGGMRGRRDFQCGDRARRWGGYVRRSDGGRHQSKGRSGQTQVKRARPSPALRPPAFCYRSAFLCGDRAEPVLSGAEGPRPIRAVRSAGSGSRATELYCEAVRLADLAARHGTPLYVYSAAMIRARLNAFAHAFRSIPHTLCYSVKANSTLESLRLVAGEGAGFDVVSGGELQRVLRASRKAANKSKVVFSGVGKTAVEMELALRSGILLFNIESASELNLLSTTATRLKKPAAIAVRVNPDVSAKTHPYISTGLHQHKFGVPIPEARTLYAQAAKQPYLKVAGVSVHIGSQITDVGSFHEALERVADLVRGVRDEGHDIRYIDPRRRH